jgi:uncharacterized membrane protein YtjA (UPF0391 family)
MLKWAAIFFVIAIIAGLLGFTGVAGVSMDIAQLLFGIFLFLAVLAIVAGLFIAKKVT